MYKLIRRISSVSNLLIFQVDSASPAKRRNVECPPKSSDSVLKDIIENNLDDDSETNKAVAQSTVDIISDVCSTLDITEPPSSPKEIGTIQLSKCFSDF